ncbi:hypothetical protein Acr_03g0001020 [Actinidia rufa]|uniref:Uncharacterized protein n=1 Tax=Actinidia rufa TaxID=165716 RepID=A0A7J0EA36_9ERIC|nr:hypothetical protein Acr_03g0001020 [Actinidia rufa]
MPSKRKAKSRSSSEASSSSNKKSKIPVEADSTYGARDVSSRSTELKNPRHQEE